MYQCVFRIWPICGLGAQQGCNDRSGIRRFVVRSPDVVHGLCSVYCISLSVPESVVKFWIEEFSVALHKLRGLITEKLEGGGKTGKKKKDKKNGKDERKQYKTSG